MVEGYIAWEKILGGDHLPDSNHMNLIFRYDSLTKMVVQVLLGMDGDLVTALGYDARWRGPRISLRCSNTIARIFHSDLITALRYRLR